LCVEKGIPEPEVELHFHPDRKWRFDIAWPSFETPETDDGYSRPLGIEIQGGTYSHGAALKHSRGAGMKNDMEKHNEAVRLGWRVILLDSSMIASAPKRRKTAEYVLSFFNE
jgi:hypothetical protein